jgi:hypothetical protein
MDLVRVNNFRVIYGAYGSKLFGRLIISRICRERVDLIANEMNSFGGAKM